MFTDFKGNSLRVLVLRNSKEFHPEKYILEFFSFLESINNSLFFVDSLGFNRVLWGWTFSQGSAITTWVRTGYCEAHGCMALPAPP